MVFNWFKKKIKNIWHNIEVMLDIDTYEGWLRNGLAISTGLGLLFIGFWVGLGLLITKLMGIW